MAMASLAVLLDRRTSDQRWKYGLNQFEYYIQEILTQAGIPYHVVDHIGNVNKDSCDILIAALEADDEQTSSFLWDFAESGGTVISYGGLARLAPKLGCIEESPIGVGYADVSGYCNAEHALRFLEAQPWRVINQEDQRIQQQGALMDRLSNKQKLGSSLHQFTVGSGYIHRWSVRIVNTVVGLQQGTHPVIRDGVPAPDGTGPVNDGILKADDGISLDWERDRESTHTGQPYFNVPYADLWREVLISHLLQAAVQKGLYLPFLDYWPEGVSAVATISHDSDGNEDEAAEATLKLLKETDIQSTWCMMEPGYSASIYDQIIQAGHELGFHYNALEKDKGYWDKEEFARQLRWLRDAAGIDKITTNKNHYTRFEGWGELFEWCESEGVQADQTRGPSKKGNVGFLFGTCHPYFPISWWDQQNRMYDVLQIGFLTQDMDIGAWADTSVIAPFLDKVLEVRGVAHFLFHQFHIYRRPEVRKAFGDVVQQAKEKGYAFWTSEQINDWIRSRRQVKIAGIQGDSVELQADQVPEGLVVWIPVMEEELSSSVADTDMRFGVLCRKMKLS